MLSVQNENCVVEMYLNQHCCNSCVLFEMPLFPSLFSKHAILNFPVPLYVSPCFNNRDPCKKTGRGFIG